VSLLVHEFVEVPFRRIVDRCLLGLALIGIWPLIKGLGLTSWVQIGVRADRPIIKDIATGLLIGSMLLGLAAVSALLFGASVWDSSRPPGPGRVIGFLVSAIAVAFFEEILFRGAIFTAFRRTWTDGIALWCSSAIYAIVHFFARPEDPKEIQWYSGFQMLGGMLRGFTEFQAVVPGFLSLTVLGIILALAYRKSGALWLSMGIHAALVFWIKLFASATNPAAGANLWFWGTERLIDGWFCFILLTITTVYLFQRKYEPGRGHPAHDLSARVRILRG
jgi:uncharacterized protein